jgi:hypothetical protein
MKAYIIGIILAIQLYSCAPTNKILSTIVPTKPAYSFTSDTEKILIINSYDIAAKKFRDNKEEFFISLMNSTLHQIESEIHRRSGFKTALLTDLTKISSDSIPLLLQKNGASHLFAVTNLDAYFTQTHVDVTKTSSGKERKAFYNIVSTIGCSFYASPEDHSDTTITSSKFHSTRYVLSGLLAAGPNIVSNHKDAENMVSENVTMYLNSFFPGTAKRNRTIFTTKEFATVAASIKVGDYEAALQTCLLLSAGTDKLIAAKALYNCAVFAELKNNYDEAAKYLKQSLSTSSLWEAKIMQTDYQY